MTPPSAAASSVQRGTKLAPPRSRPRRVSGPVRPPRTGRRTTAPATGQDGLVLGLLGAVESLSSNRLLDRLIRGRMWIGLLAFALIGIVTLQLGLLKLNSGIGKSIELASRLETENASLSIENSELAGGARVESQGERLGMRLVPVEGLHFLYSHARGDVPRAAAILRQPVRPSSGAGSEASQATSSTGAPEAATPATTGTGAAQTPAPGGGAPVGPAATSESERAPAESSSGSGTASSRTPSEAAVSGTGQAQAPPGASSTESSTPAPGGGTASPAG